MNNDLLTKAQNNIVKGSDYVKPAIDQYAAALINDLLTSIKACKTSWKLSCDNFQDPEELEKFSKNYKGSLLKAMSENGINTPEQVAAGMKKCRADPGRYLPSVGEFIEWCKPDPSDYGLPSVDQAYLECCNNSHQPVKHKWSHNVIYQAGRKAGWYEIRNASSKAQVSETKKSFIQAYERACSVIMAGGDISGPEVVDNALEDLRGGDNANTDANTVTEQNKAAQKKAMQALRGKL